MDRRFAWIFVFILIFFLLPLNASDNNEIEHHIIVEYQFKISGSSKEHLIKRMIVPVTGDPVFSSLEELEQALAQKRQILFNTRVFTSVEYRLEKLDQQDNTSYYKVVFDIDDAFTLLAIPYPKYDSNYGFRIGLKGWEANLFGTFASVTLFSHITQVNDSWGGASIGGELGLSKLPIGSSYLNLSGSVSGNIKDKGVDLSSYSGTITWSDIPIGQTLLTLSGSIDEKLEPYGSLLWKGFTVGSSQIVLTSVFNQEKVLSTALNWSSIPLRSTFISFEPSFEITKQSLHSWTVSRVDLGTTIYPILIDKFPFLLATSIGYEFLTKQGNLDLSLEMQNVTIGQHPVTPSVSYSTLYDVKKNFVHNTKYSLNLETSFNLPYGFTYTPSLATSVLVNSKLESFFTPIISTSHSISGTSLNWYNNFRKGLSGKLTLFGEYLFLPSNIGFDFEALTLTAEINATGFARLGNRVGLSSRLMGYFYSIPTNDTTETEFTFFMPDYELEPADELRGILTKSFDSVATTTGQNKRKLGLTANFDATLLLIKINRLGEGFINAFYDFGIFTTSSNAPSNTITQDNLHIFNTVGLEGYVIFDRFRSYPIRVSVGFNLDHIVEYAKKQRTPNEVEFEIYIGMGLLY